MKCSYQTWRDKKENKGVTSAHWLNLCLENYLVID